MTIWRLGMLAVCIDDSPIKVIKGTTEIPPHISIPKKGEIGMIVQIVEDSYGLGLIGIKIEGEKGGLSTRFRPAVQDWQSERQSKVSWLDDFIKGRVSV